MSYLYIYNNLTDNVYAVFVKKNPICRDENNKIGSMSLKVNPSQLQVRRNRLNRLQVFTEK